MVTEMTQGEDLTFNLTVTDKAGAVIDLTGYALKFQVRKRPADSDPTALISKSSSVSTEIDIYDPVNGLARIFILPADTLAAAGIRPDDYVYDVWAVSPTTIQSQIISTRTFRIHPRVTVI